MVYYIDWDVYTDAMTRLAQNQYQISDYSETSFNGTITTAKDGQTVLTTIPYDEGWQIYVDGEKVEIFETLDALIAFNVPTSGNHELRMRYMPRAFIIGLTVTLISIALFAVMAVFHKKLIIKDRRAEQDGDNALPSDVDYVADKLTDGASEDGVATTENTQSDNAKES